MHNDVMIDCQLLCGHVCEATVAAAETVTTRMLVTVLTAGYRVGSAQRVAAAVAQSLASTARPTRAFPEASSVSRRSICGRLVEPRGAAARARPAGRILSSRRVGARAPGTLRLVHGAQLCHVTNRTVNATACIEPHSSIKDR